MNKKVKTNCRFCGYQCGLLATVEDGRVVAVEPDPSQYPGDPEVQNGCHRWRHVPEFMDHPERINYPLKRVGVGLSRLGTSRAVGLGAYAFALHSLSRPS